MNNDKTINTIDKCVIPRLQQTTKLKKLRFTPRNYQIFLRHQIVLRHSNHEDCLMLMSLSRILAASHLRKSSILLCTIYCKINRLIPPQKPVWGSNTIIIIAMIKSLSKLTFQKTISLTKTLTSWLNFAQILIKEASVSMVRRAACFTFGTILARICSTGRHW